MQWNILGQTNNSLPFGWDYIISLENGGGEYLIKTQFENKDKSKFQTHTFASKKEKNVLPQSVPNQLSSRNGRPTIHHKNRYVSKPARSLKKTQRESAVLHSNTFLPTQDIKQTKNKGEQEKPLDNKTVATTDTMQPNNNKQTYVFVASPCQTQSKDKDGHQVNNCNKSVTIPGEMKQQNKEHTFGKKTVSNFDETQPKNNGRPLIMSGMKPVLDQDQLQPRKTKGPENLHNNSIKPVVNQDQLQPKNTKGSENLHGNKSISGKVKPLIINGIEPVLDQYQLQPRNIKEPENPRDFKSIEASGQVKPLIMSTNKPLLDQDQLQPKNTKGQENLHDNKSIATSDQVKPLLMSGIKPVLDQYQLQPKNTKGSENPHDYKSIETSGQVKPLLNNCIKPVLDQDQIQPKNTKVPENLRDIKPIATSGQVKPLITLGNQIKKKNCQGYFTWFHFFSVFRFLNEKNTFPNQV